MPKVWTDSKFLMPERLYRYRPLSSEEEWGYFEPILLDSTMYGAPPPVLRKKDPLDCRIALNAICTPDEFKLTTFGKVARQQHPGWSEAELNSYLCEWHKKLMEPDFDPDLVAALQLSADQYGVICFSPDGDIQTQWQTYASGGQGVCLVFDPLKNLDFFGKVKPVDYVDVLEPANVFTDESAVQVRKRLYTKLAKYEGEAEFRALFPGRSGQQIPFTPDALIEVRLGPAMTAEDRGRLTMILQCRSAKIGLEV